MVGVAFAKEASPNEMDARRQVDRTRTAARQSFRDQRLAGREWERRWAATRTEKEAVITSLLAKLRERFMIRTGASADQFARFLPRLLDATCAGATPTPRSRPG
jgi:hypothetical protein